MNSEFIETFPATLDVVARMAIQLVVVTGDYLLLRNLLAINSKCDATFSLFAAFFGKLKDALMKFLFSLDSSLVLLSLKKFDSSLALLSLKKFELE
jgi:hypothetical protein